MFSSSWRIKLSLSHRRKGSPSCKSLIIWSMLYSRSLREQRPGYSRNRISQQDALNNHKIPSTNSTLRTTWLSSYRIELYPWRIWLVLLKRFSYCAKVRNQQCLQRTLKIAKITNFYKKMLSFSKISMSMKKHWMSSIKFLDAMIQKMK